jgi:tetratricopeptide (TPR) repeat protein
MFKGKLGEILKKAFMILGGLSFLWVTASGIFEMMFKPPTQQASQTETLSPQEKLQEAAKGYESVLENEPNNRFALEELVKVRLQLGDLQAALKPTEKLVKLEPENQRYQEVLSKIKAGLAQEKLPPSHQNSPSPSQENSSENKNVNE